MASMTSRALTPFAALALGACFTGTFLAGQPCVDDAECGPNLSCDDGRCGGGAASATSTSTSEPATSTSTSTTSTSTSTSTTAEPTTSTSTSTSTSTTGDESTSTTGPSCGIGSCTDLDVLLVVDNSPSMDDDSERLVALLLAFSDKLLPTLKQACSVHVGLVTTNAYAPSPEKCRKLGALVSVDNNGEPCPFAEGFPYATSADLGDPTKLACIALVGNEGNPNERPYDALISTLNAQNNDGCNEGFIREDAFLAVLMVTDEDDGENDDPQGHDGSDTLDYSLWFSALQTVKGDNIYLALVTGDEDQENTLCPWDPLNGPDGIGASDAPHLRALAEKFPDDHRAIGSMCHAEASPEVFYPLMDEILGDLNSVCGAR